MNIQKVEKLVVNLYDKTEYVIHIRNFKQALNHGLVLKKVHKAIKFDQDAEQKTIFRYEQQKMILKNFLLG